MTDTLPDPRIAALWIMHGRACAELLRAHGRVTHAENHDIAIDALMDILADEFGADRLAAAIDWVSESMWSNRVSSPSNRFRN